jgi:hypothetical protein
VNIPLGAPVTIPTLPSSILLDTVTGAILVDEVLLICGRHMTRIV